MKIALLGDIHANEYALSSVLIALSKAKVDKILLTGDLVGYYFSPLKVLELLNKWDKVIVRGNHEEMLAKARNDSYFLRKIDAHYGSGLRIAIEQLNLDQLDMLCSLPHPVKLEIDNIHILLCHGSPWDVEQYVYPNAEDELISRCVTEQSDLVVMGHTHYPMLKKIGETIIVNPGSVGQPRNRIPGASWALFETSDRSVTFHNELYDTTFLVNECKLRHPELPYLFECLVRT